MNNLLFKKLIEEKNTETFQKKKKMKALRD